MLAFMSDEARATFKPAPDRATPVPCATPLPKSVSFGLSQSVAASVCSAACALTAVCHISDARINVHWHEVNSESCVVHIIRDAVPGLVLVLVLTTAAIPAERIAASSTRGRARTAVAYLAGFGTGLLMSALVATFAALRRDPQPLGALCLFGSFLGPFVGLTSASFPRSHRKRRRVDG